MSEVTDVLRRIIALLDGAGIPHMVAGSFASALYGTSRSTQHIDLVIDPDHQALDGFVASLPPSDYYVSKEAARDALRRRALFNVVDMATGWKIDLIIRKARPFSVEEFRRRSPARIFDVDLFVASLEDTILTKLEWSAMSGSERQLRDVRGMLDVSGSSVDLEYVERWAAELGVLALWRQVSAG